MTVRSFPFSVWLATRVLAVLGEVILGIQVHAQGLTLVELNCENLFDCRHDSLKNDFEWTPEGKRNWTPGRLGKKVVNIAQEILSCKQNGMPELIALAEVENDSVLHQLVHKSPLRRAGYEYLATTSPDRRGIDVALLYQPAAFNVICYDCIEVEPISGMRPTRDILYVRGETTLRDTLSVFVVHAPSQFGGERHSRPFRQQVISRLLKSVKALNQTDKVIVCGDFNEEADGRTVSQLSAAGLHNVSAGAKGRYGKALGTYRYQGRWQYIDHVFVSMNLAGRVRDVKINDAPFLLERDEKYGGWKPFRAFDGYQFQGGFSDHLPLVVTFD